MKTSLLLKASRARIQYEKDWIQNQMAVNWRGIAVSPGSPTACRFCSFGALAATAQALWPEEYKRLNYPPEVTEAEVCLDFAMGGSCAVFNDNNSHISVLERWDRAIAYAERLENG